MPVDRCPPDAKSSHQWSFGRPAEPGWTLRRFRAAFAACLPLLAALVVLKPAFPAAGAELEILNGGYPRAFFFRQAEGIAARPDAEYEPWSTQFERLMGIIGKAADEEVPGRSRNVAFFTRFKREHPDQLVMLHFNGNARDPRFEPERFFAGHWIYHNGAAILDDLPAARGEAVFKVSDASLFKVGMGRYHDKNEDIGLCELNPAGRPDWSRAEQVQLLGVDLKNNTIRVRRGCFGTKPRVFKRGRAYAAAHCSEGPWGKQSNLLWFYNYSTTCPKDAQGRTCADHAVQSLAEMFDDNGPLAAFDGLEFDVLFNSHGGRHGERGIDIDADGRRDDGWVDGVNVYGSGVIEFIRLLRRKLDEDKLILGDGSFRGLTQQRAFGLLNGIESEGWPGLWDKEVQDWSGGLNRHFFWSANGRAPVFNYINHKFIEPGDMAGRPERRPEVPFNIHRLVFAAAVFTDSAVTFAYAPPGFGRNRATIWDELVKGSAQEPGWLGQPLGPAQRMALKTPDLLAGRGHPFTSDFVRRVSSEDAVVTLDHGRLKAEAKDTGAREFAVTFNDLPLDGPDLTVALKARCAPPAGHPAEMARLIKVSLMGPEEMLISPDLPDLKMALRNQPEAPARNETGASIRFLPRATFENETHAAYFTHPPYRDGKGYSAWERRIAVPAEAELVFFTAISEAGETRGDGVVFQIEAAPDDQLPKSLLRAHETRARWTERRVDLTRYASQTIKLRFIADCGPADNTTADHAHWGDVQIVPRGAAPLSAEAALPETHMSWVDERGFQSVFYFSKVQGKRGRLRITVDFPEPLWINALSLHAVPDLMTRSFENGFVLANPSPRQQTLDLSLLAPGRAFRRLKGTPAQDPSTNNGRPVGKQILLKARDALFLFSASPDSIRPPKN